MADWTNATRWPDDEPDEVLCLWPARSMWPIRNYDGRWRCSMPLGHEEHNLPHVAFTEHNPAKGLAWVGGWVPAELFEEPGRPMTGPHPHNMPETWRDDGKCIVKSCGVYRT